MVGRLLALLGTYLRYGSVRLLATAGNCRYLKDEDAL